MKHTRTSTDNDYKKPQAYHEITKEEWWKLNRPGREIKHHWGGKEVCRWYVFVLLESCRGFADLAGVSISAWFLRPSNVEDASGRNIVQGNVSGQIGCVREVIGRNAPEPRYRV